MCWGDIRASITSRASRENYTNQQYREQRWWRTRRRHRTESKWKRNVLCWYLIHPGGLSGARSSGWCYPYQIPRFARIFRGPLLSRGRFHREYLWGWFSWLFARPGFSSPSSSPPPPSTFLLSTPTWRSCLLLPSYFPIYILSFSLWTNIPLHTILLRGKSWIEQTRKINTIREWELIRGLKY